MFGFLGMIGNYEDRKVDRYEDDSMGLVVSTAMVTDSDRPYETAVAHPSYNGGDFVIVEIYDTKEDAQEGHNEWVAKMTADTLPNGLIDVSTSELAELCDAFKADDSEWRIKEKNDSKTSER